MIDHEFKNHMVNGVVLKNRWKCTKCGLDFTVDIGGNEEDVLYIHYFDWNRCDFRVIWQVIRE